MKTVGVAELKAKLSEHLRRVKRGELVVVEERGTPIAEIHPIEAPPPRLHLRPATRRLADVPFPRRGKGEQYTADDIERDRRGRRR
jgi:prevent-host-death family protein